MASRSRMTDTPNPDRDNGKPTITRWKILPEGSSGEIASWQNLPVLRSWLPFLLIGIAFYCTISIWLGSVTLKKCAAKAQKKEKLQVSLEHPGFTHFSVVEKLFSWFLDTPKGTRRRHHQFGRKYQSRQRLGEPATRGAWGERCKIRCSTVPHQLARCRLGRGGRGLAGPA
jgi:hypothetical protein